MLPSRLAKRFCLVSLALCLAAADAQAGEAALKDAVPHLTVTGTAKADVVPDLAIISLGVMTERPKAADAVDENARATQKIVDEIKAQGIDARDIKTTQVTLAPVYDTVTDDVTHTTKQKLRGYRARNTLEVRVRQLDRAGALAGTWVEKGANEFHGLRFVIEHPDAILEKLRGEAVADALRQAEAYLPALGVKLGRVIEINGLNDGATPTYYSFTGGAALDGGQLKAAAPIPVEPGTQILATSIQLTWELLQ
jgi:uncharacterized protein